MIDSESANAASAKKKSGGKKSGGKMVGKSGGKSLPNSSHSTSASSDSKRNRKKKYFVQMSSVWIADKLSIGIRDILLREEIMRSYCRHLFFTPLYHPSMSPKAHAEAQLSNSPEETHREHAGFHYGEEEVRIAVNKRLASLRKKFGELDILKEEAKQTV